MTRVQLEHVIRACGGITDDTHIVIVGSQAILGAYPEAPAELFASIEAEMYPHGAKLPSVPDSADAAHAIQ